MKPRWRFYIGMFVLFSCWGAFWEWLIGLTAARLGRALYVYPSSPLLFASWETLPLWGLGGLQALTLCSFVKNKDARKLITLGVLVLMTLLWVCLLSLLSTRPLFILTLDEESYVISLVVTILILCSSLAVFMYAKERRSLCDIVTALGEADLPNLATASITGTSILAALEGVILTTIFNSLFVIKAYKITVIVILVFLFGISATFCFISSTITSHSSIFLKKLGMECRRKFFKDSVVFFLLGLLLFYIQLLYVLIAGFMYLGLPFIIIFSIIAPSIVISLAIFYFLYVLRYRAAAHNN